MPLDRVGVRGGQTVPETRRSFASPVAGPEAPAAGGRSSQPGGPAEAMPESDGRPPPGTPPAGYGGAARTPREAASAAGEGWGRSISVTCAEKEVLSRDRLGHLLSPRQGTDRGGTRSSPDVLSIIGAVGRAGFPPPPPVSRPQPSLSREDLDKRLGGVGAGTPQAATGPCSWAVEIPKHRG